MVVAVVVVVVVVAIVVVAVVVAAGVVVAGLSSYWQYPQLVPWQVLSTTKHQGSVK